MRRAIFILAALGTGLPVVEHIVYFIVGGIASPSLHDVNQAFGRADPFIIGIFLAANVLAYILGLVDTARRGRWGWFAAVLLLPVLGALIYGATGLRAPDTTAEAAS